MPDAVKAKTQQFTRRKSNLVKKADQLARLCQADLALIIRKNGRYYTYRSTDHQRWPPTITEIVCITPTHRPWVNSTLECIISLTCQSAIRRLWERCSQKPAQVGSGGSFEWKVRFGRARVFWGHIGFKLSCDPMHGKAEGDISDDRGAVDGAGRTARNLAEE